MKACWTWSATESAGSLARMIQGRSRVLRVVRSREVKNPKRQRTAALQNLAGVIACSQSRQRLRVRLSYAAFVVPRAFVVVSMHSTFRGRPRILSMEATHERYADPPYKAFTKALPA